MNVYESKGYKNRQDYLEQLAKEYDISILTVQALADTLGPNEDFDGLITSIEDEAEAGDLELG